MSWRPRAPYNARVRCDIGNVGESGIRPGVVGGRSADNRRHLHHEDRARRPLSL